MALIHLIVPIKQPQKNFNSFFQVSMEILPTSLKFQIFVTVRMRKIFLGFFFQAFNLA